MSSLLRLLLALCLSAGALPVLYADSGNPLAAFVKGHASYQEGAYASAKDFFKQSLGAPFALADYSLYYLAVMAFEEKDWETLRRTAVRLQHEYPQSLWIDSVQLQLAKAELAENHFSKAAAAFRALREAKGVNRSVQEEAFFLQAQAERDAKRAYSLYQQFRELHPGSRWTASARREQAALKEKNPEIVPFHTVNSLIAEADQLVRERAHGEAEVTYKKLLYSATEPDLRLRLLSKLSALYLMLRRRSDALPLLEQIVGDFPETAEAPRALYQIGHILWNRHDNVQALETFKRVMTLYPGSAVVDRAAYAAGDIYEWLGNRDEAARHYDQVRLQFPHSQVSDDATWRLGWLYYRGDDFPEAYRMFKILSSQTKETPLRTAAQYWQGRAAEKAGDRELAKSVYAEVYDASEESYYHALAASALARLGEPIKAQNNNRPAYPRDREPEAAGRSAFHVLRARTLAELSLHSLAVAELDAVERLAGADQELRLFLSREYFKNQAYRRSLAVATQLPASNGERDFYRFPLAHWQTIQRKAQETEIDPYLILALIRQESLFDPRARSPASALGLMQLLPSTAARMARRIGLPAPSHEKLFEPEINLTLGMHYLKNLLERYSNNWHKAIAAYNAGEGAVDRWEREIATEDIEEFVERIPYLETRGYVKLVMRNHRIYKQLYGQK